MEGGWVGGSVREREEEGRSEGGRERGREGRSERGVYKKMVHREGEAHMMNTMNDSLLIYIRTMDMYSSYNTLEFFTVFLFKKFSSASMSTKTAKITFRLHFILSVPREMKIN